MEYIGKEKKDGRDITVYTGHIATANNIKRYKKFFLLFLVALLVASVLIFPFHIGSAIGYWVSQFVSGIKSHF